MQGDGGNNASLLFCNEKDDPCFLSSLLSVVNTPLRYVCGTPHF